MDGPTSKGRGVAGPPGPSRREFLRGAGGAAAVVLAGGADPGGPRATASSEEPHLPDPGGPAPGSEAKRSDPALGLPPILARPTETSVVVNARNGPARARAWVELRRQGASAWTVTGTRREAPARGIFEWTVGGLQPGLRYEYRVFLEPPGGPAAPVAEGRFVTRRLPGDAYGAVLLTDAHVGSFEEGTDPLATLDDVVRNAVADEPDFVMALGDNVAWGSSRDHTQRDADEATRAYEMYRRHVGPLVASAPHFGLVGNWEGESGKFPAESIERVRSVRTLLLPNPDAGTYRQGGSEGQDYFAFSWGDALWIALNVQSYTTATQPGVPARQDVATVRDWTLGPTQLAWLERTLVSSREAYVFVCVHHPVGGNGGNGGETLYGRGGGRAATVGEQAAVHALMRRHGVQALFYGHDHVFVDDVIDGIHYALPGSCGAPWKFGRDLTGYDRFWPDSGHARVRVSPAAAAVEYVSREGEVLHRFELTPRG